ncbi:MAG TPA: pirin family protein, partial [Streptomyces sp.]|nr:pirin family protein [Streptomyces sp.]
MLHIRREADRHRGGEAAAGIETRHAFSFSGFYDP